MLASQTLYPHAKINLHLEVGKKRADGFHEICSLMQEISIADEMVVRLSALKACDIKVLGANIGGDNTLIKAFDAFKRLTKEDFGIEIFLLKRIPLGAGLGGASSDAASLILAMDSLLGTRLKYDELLKIALEVGSDVPFFLTGGSAKVSGRGDDVIAIKLDASYVGILVYPEFQSITKEAYAVLDASVGFRELKSIEEINLFEMPVSNSFEAPLFLMHPKLKEIKEDFLTFAADLSLMTGAGSCVYGLFRSWEKAGVAWDYISKKWKKCGFFIPIEK